MIVVLLRKQEIIPKENLICQLRGHPRHCLTLVLFGAEVLTKDLKYKK